MKITSLELQNVKSIGSSVKLRFEEGVNILIGPNGSGKSNVMDILNVVLHTYFIWHWHQEEEEFGKIRYVRHALDGFFDLPRHFDFDDTQQQVIKITITFSKDDLANIAIIRDHFDEIIQIEKSLSDEENNEMKRILGPALDQVSQETLEANPEQSFTLEGSELLSAPPENFTANLSAEQLLWFRYLNYREKIKYLIEQHNKDSIDIEKWPELKFNLKFFSPNRFHEGQRFEISLPGQSLTEKYKQSKQKTSKNTSSDVDYSAYSFAREYNNLAMENQALLEKGEDIGTLLFEDNEKVKEAKTLLSVVGDYDFAVEDLNRNNNTFRFKIKTGDQEITFDALSSGEKEIINLILIIAALDLRDACILIDEPEIHLHPQWQYKLTKLFYKLCDKRNMQFIISTHSPVFVNRQTVENIFRIYKPKNQTLVVPESKNTEWKSLLKEEKQLIDVITYSNNSKIFFAEKVLLVEGITDEIIFSYLVEQLGGDKGRIEVISVNGKDNFSKYINFLGMFKIMPVIICDLDNLWGGKLLADQSILKPLKAKIEDIYTSKRNESNALSSYMSNKTTKEKVTNKEVGERICQILQKLKTEENIDTKDRTFISLWSEKCIDKKKIFGELQIDQIYKDKDASIKTLDHLCERINIALAGSIPCLVHVLRRGSIEDYADDMSHSQDGALSFLGTIRAYIEENRTDDTRIEELKDIVGKALKS